MKYLIIGVLCKETACPPDLRRVVRSIYKKVAEGGTIDDGSFIPLSTSRGRPIFDDPENVGLLLSRDHGQQLHGVPLPKVSCEARAECLIG